MGRAQILTVVSGDPLESLLGEEEVLSRETGITAEEGHNFWSHRWIALKYLQ
jgi:hypothetical protein